MSWLKQTIKKDLERISGTSSIKDFFRWYFFPKGTTFKYTVWMRIMMQCKKNNFLKYSVGIPVYLLYRHYEYKYGIHVDDNVPIGAGIKIVHSDCVYINCESIGSNLTIYQGCTLGSGNGQDGKKLRPIVGNNVTIYTGAVVTGSIKLGDGCIIGANSFVNIDVPPFAFVAGIPARIIRMVDDK